MMIVARGIFTRGLAFATAKKSQRRASQSRSNTQAPLEKDVFKAYRSQVEKGSILRQFRQEVFRRSQLNQQWEGIQQKQDEQQIKLEQLLKGQSKQSSIKNATKIESRLTSKKNIFHENNSRSLLSDYGDYTAYNKVYPVLEDRNLEQNQFLETQHINENMYKFIDKLPDNYLEKIEIKHQFQQMTVQYQNMTITQYGKKIQNQINTARYTQDLGQQEARINQYGKRVLLKPLTEDDVVMGQDYHEQTGTKMTRDPWNEEEGLEATLSPGAIDTIYELYLQGWTVRDISKRFGIMPARTKFCVWVRAQLYHQVLPKMGAKYYIRGLEYEQGYNEQIKFCDYGLDLESLTNEGIIEQITEWNGKMRDAERKQQLYLGAMHRLSEQKKFNKYEFVEVGTHDKENSMYKLKEWVIFRGKGSDQYFLKHQVFRKLSKAHRKFSKVYY